MTDQTEPHDYLSTSCLHGGMVLPDGRTGHEYCQGDTGHAGSKTPAQCKFCGAPCTCPCHRKGQANEGVTSRRSPAGRGTGLKSRDSAGSSPAGGTVKAIPTTVFDDIPSTGDAA